MAKSASSELRVEACIALTSIVQAREYMQNGTKLRHLCTSHLRKQRMASLPESLDSLPGSVSHPRAFQTSHWLAANSLTQRMPR